jgi:hypothetical protein
MSLNIEVDDIRFGALLRDIGDTIGAFGDIVIKSNQGPVTGYVSSVNLNNLSAMEAMLTQLRSPKWPTAFSSIDFSLVRAGQQLFDKRCASCHPVPSDPGSMTEKYAVRLLPVFASQADRPAVNTDMWMACNAALDVAYSGRFAGNKAGLPGLPTIAAYAPSFILTQNALLGVLLTRKDASVLTWLKGQSPPEKGSVAPVPALLQPGMTTKDMRVAACRNVEGDTAHPAIAYRARPLQGIWATAPYLHNGSVPNLYEMLLPPAQRSKRFYLGSRVFDPRNVGFETGESDSNSFMFDTSLPGNANTGHDYNNAGLSDADRWALVEYMKSL